MSQRGGGDPLISQQSYKQRDELCTREHHVKSCYCHQIPLSTVRAQHCWGDTRLLSQSWTPAQSPPHPSKFSLPAQRCCNAHSPKSWAGASQAAPGCRMWACKGKGTFLPLAVLSWVNPAPSSPSSVPSSVHGRILRPERTGWQQGPVMGSRTETLQPSMVFAIQTPLKSQEAPPGSAGARASPHTPLQFSCPVPCRCGLSGSARGCVPGLAVTIEEGLEQAQGPFWGWPHRTVTAVAFQEGNGSAPAVQGTALPCRHLPEKTHSWKGAQRWLCLPCSSVSIGRAHLRVGEPLPAQPHAKGRPSLLTYPRAEGRTRDFQSIFLPCLSIDLLSQLEGIPFHAFSSHSVHSGELLAPLFFARGIPCGLSPFPTPGTQAGRRAPNTPLPWAPVSYPAEPAAPTHSHHLRGVAG